MLQTDPEIVITYTSPKQISGSLKLSNPTPSMIVSFKIKTTNPILFNVNPSKGFLGSNRKKEVEIILTGEHTKQEVRDIVLKEKFLIQYISIPDKMKQQDLEAEWKSQAKIEGGIKKHKLRIKFEDEGMKASDLIFQDEEGRESRDTVYKTGEVIVDEKQAEQLLYENGQTGGTKKEVKPEEGFVQQPGKPSMVSSSSTQPPRREEKNQIKLIRMAFLLAIIIVLLLLIQSIFVNRQSADIAQPLSSANPTSENVNSP